MTNLPFGGSSMTNDPILGESSTTNDPLIWGSSPYRGSSMINDPVPAITLPRQTYTIT